MSENGTIFRRFDGGATWEPQDSGTTNRLWDIILIDSDTGMAVGDNGTILRTIDGGG